MSNYNTQYGFVKRYDYVDIATGDDSETFKQKLLAKFGDINQCLAMGKERKVIFTSVMLEKSACAYVKSIIDFLSEVQDLSPSCCIIVLVGCYREKIAWWQKTKQDRVLKKLINSGAKELPPLAAVSSFDLCNWLKELPPNILELFDKEVLLKEFRLLLPDETRKFYYDIQDDVEQLLSEHIHV